MTQCSACSRGVQATGRANPANGETTKIMLTEIRNRFTNAIGIAILAVIALSFVFVGVNMSFTGRGYFASVNGIDVQPGEIEVAYQRQAEAFRSQFGTITPELDQRLRLDAQEQVLTQAVIRSYFDDAEFAASDAAVAEIIRSNPQFSDNGTFSRELYEQALSFGGQLPAQYEQRIAESMQLTQLRDGIGGSSFVAPSELRRYIELTRETRTVAYAVFALDPWLPEAEPAPERVEAYYADNAARYQTEAAAKLSYVELSLDAVAAGLEVDEAALQTYYEGVRDNYLTESERNPRHILITVENNDDDAAETLATSLVQRVNAGEDFAALAAEFSKDGGTASNGGDLGWVRPGQFVGSVDEAVFAMDVDEVRGPIKSEFGYHIVRLDGVREGGVPALDEVRADVEADFRRQQADVLFDEKNARLGDELFDNPDALETFAENLALEIRTIDRFTRATAAVFQNSPDVVAAVFGENAVRGTTLSEPIEYTDDSVVVLRVDTFSPAATRPLDEVKTDIVAALQRDDARAARETALADIITSPPAADALAAALTELGGEFTAENAVDRQALATLPGSLGRELFAARPPESGALTVGLAPGAGDDAIVYALSAISPGNPAAISEAEREALRRRIAEQRGIADLGAFVATLRDEADIKFGSLASTNTDADL